MKTITVSNEKGGVGKTTISTTIAAGLAARGYKVLLIDADAQGHATRSFGLAKYPGFYDLLVREADYQSVIKTVPATKYGGDKATLAIIGSNVETRNIAGSISDAWAVSDRLEPLTSLFDVCIIDTSPTPSLLHGAIWLATDVIIYPTLCEFWSFDGLAESITHRKKFEEKKRIDIAGIVPTRYRANTLEHSENLQKLCEKFGDLVWPAIPERIVWAEAATYQTPVFMHDPNSDAAQSAWTLIARSEELLHG